MKCSLWVLLLTISNVSVNFKTFCLLMSHQMSVQAQVDQEAALRVQMMDENERLLDLIDELKNETELLRASLGQYLPF